MSGRRLPFLAWVGLVAAASWLIAAGTSHWLRSDGGRRASGSELEPDVVEALYGASSSESAPVDRDRRLGTFWVHPECVACFHYLGSMLEEAKELEADGAGVVFVVLGQPDETEPLTRFIPHSVLHDTEGRLFEAAGISLTPQFLLVTADGSVVRHGRGPSGWGMRDPARPEPAGDGIPES